MNAEDVSLTLVTRPGWEALDPIRAAPPLIHPVENVVMAYNTEVKGCFDKEECKERMRELQQLHQDRGLADIHYK